jgi:FkbM family methyltransferase
MKHIYLDCGFYSGMTLQRYLDKGIVDKSWIIYAFEPNEELKKREFPVDIIMSNAAVWIKDGTVTFDIGGREDSSCIEGTAGHTDPKKIKVPSIDFSKFVRELPEAYIACSMDIEGAEFKVLEKMLEEHTIDKIDFLEIEFHHRLMNGYEPEDAEKLIKQIEERGVKIKLKEALR